MRGRLLFAVAVLGMAWAQAGLAEPSVNDLAARTELRAIPTLTLTDQQFLTGDSSGKAVTIGSELRIPRGVSGKIPAVVLLHGSGGPNGGHEFWAKHFNEMGIATLLIDSFSERGIVSTSANQALLGKTFEFLPACGSRTFFAEYPERASHALDVDKCLHQKLRCSPVTLHVTLWQ